MKKVNKKILLSFGSVAIVASTIISVVSCAGYNPSKGDLSNRNFLSGKYAYNKVLADYYQSTVDKMFNDTKNTGNTLTVDLKALRFDTYQWTIEANAIKDHDYWTTQKNEWIKNGTFIGSMNKLTGKKIINVGDNEAFIKQLFEVYDISGDITNNPDPYGQYVWILKNDVATFEALGGWSSSGDIGSGVIMDVDRTLYSMAYLLLTKSEDVQNWLVGDPNDPDKKGEGKLDPLETNSGQYFFIDYLRQSKPFIMWKNEIKDPSIKVDNFDGTAKDVDTFNKIPNTTLELQNSLESTLLLSGSENGFPTPKPEITNHLKELASYAGLQTTNPFTKNGEGPVRTGDINPNDANMKTINGGKQGWVNNDGSIQANKGDAVYLDASTRDYAYVQQLLPGWNANAKQFIIPEWMEKTMSNNTTGSGEPGNVASLWNVAFQIIFYGGSILDSAKNYWVNHGYDLKVHIPVLENNLGPEHIYE